MADGAADDEKSESADDAAPFALPYAPPRHERGSLRIVLDGIFAATGAILAAGLSLVLGILFMRSIASDRDDQWRGIVVFAMFALPGFVGLVFGIRQFAKLIRGTYFGSEKMRRARRRGRS